MPDERHLEDAASNLEASFDLTGAVPHESQLSDNAGKLAVGSAGTQGKAKFEASF